MRRTVFLTLGVLEILVALVLLAFSWQLPGPAEVHGQLGRVYRVGQETEHQLRALRGQLQALRERRPQLHQLAVRLQQEMRAVTDQLRHQQVDYPTVRQVSDALGDVAGGLDGLSETLDPEGVARIGVGLKTAADYLENQVAPTAAEVAARLDRATADMKADAEQLSSLLRTAPLDLKAARDIHDSLGRFGTGLERLDAMLKLQRIDAMREGFKGLEDSLSTGATQVERLSAYTYPAVRFEGLRPVIEQKQFWPEGDRIAEGMRKAAKGTTAAGEELEQLTRDLPKLRDALAESRNVATATRQALGKALQEQDKVEALLKDVPRHAARLADELPRLGEALARVLRDTSGLREVAGLLRQTQRGIDLAVARWPQLQRNLGRSAVLLRATQGQLRYVLEHRDEYEAAMQRTLLVSRSFSAALPLLTEQLETDLEEQDRSLANLGSGVHEVTATLPDVAGAAGRLVQTTRLLLLLVAAVFALHGLSLALPQRRKVEPPLAAPAAVHDDVA
jgi:hypothetical protein